MLPGPVYSTPTAKTSPTLSGPTARPTSGPPESLERYLERLLDEMGV